MKTFKKLFNFVAMVSAENRNDESGMYQEMLQGYNLSCAQHGGQWFCTLSYFGLFMLFKMQVIFCLRGL